MSSIRTRGRASENGHTWAPGGHGSRQYCDLVTSRRIDTPSGPFLVEDANGLVHARGIRYASAARFAAPEPSPASADVVDATQRGPACPQLPSRLQFVTGRVVDGLSMSEQCQVLSVTAPADADGLPVMVWFHGGAYVAGSGEAVRYDPDALVREGRVVVVNVSYRLGVFGYLNLVDRDTENLGLRDQICALQWVNANIAAFGGDPARVTLFGQSAGGDSVVSLLLCAESSRLISRAILHSAPSSLQDGRAAMTAAMREAAASALAGVPPAEASTELLLDAQVAAVTVAARFGLIGLLAFAPITGCAPLPPAGEIAARMADAAARVEILAGYTRDDARPFAALTPRGRLAARLGPVGKVAVAGVTRTLTRRLFGARVTELAEIWRAAGGRAATFLVDWSPPRAPLGACHCIELPLLLGAPGSWSDASMLGPEPDRIDIELARRTRARWSAFAHGGIAALGQKSLRIG
jgi:para-nitrobenzyl esterase